MSPNPSAVLAESADEVALSYFQKLILVAPGARWATVSLCSRILADPRTSSDALLVIADGLREVAFAAARTTTAPRTITLLTDRELRALSRLADAMESEAPSRARTRQP